jgi:nucleotide-binding universal stress UspA family protein
VTAAAATGTRVVVGVDRSEGSRAALRHAAREAAAHDAELVVVHAWEPPFEHVHGTQTAEVLRVAALQQATETLDDVLAQARADGSWAVGQVTARPVRGEASAVLLAAVRPGDLLVVGANRGELVRRVLLGSVSSRVVRSARCPVVVVPAVRRRARRQPSRTGRTDRAALAAAGR